MLWATGVAEKNITERESEYRLYLLVTETQTKQKKEEGEDIKESELQISLRELLPSHLMTLTTTAL